jgi:hypothetical protein
MDIVGAGEHGLNHMEEQLLSLTLHNRTGAATDILCAG